MFNELQLDLVILQVIDQGFSKSMLGLSRKKCILKNASRLNEDLESESKIYINADFTSNE